jgi:hypothetical protein
MLTENLTKIKILLQGLVAFLMDLFHFAQFILNILLNVIPFMWNCGVCYHTVGQEDLIS